VREIKKTNCLRKDPGSQLASKGENENQTDGWARDERLKKGAYGRCMGKTKKSKSWDETGKNPEQ